MPRYRTASKTRKLPTDVLRALNQGHWHVISQERLLAPREITRFRRRRTEYLKILARSIPVFGEPLKRIEAINMYL